MTHHYDNPESSGLSFDERVGAAHPSAAGIGHVLVRFNGLNKGLSEALCVLKAFEPAIPHDDICLLGFETKLDALSNLVRSLATVAPFNVGPDEPVACWEIIKAQCLRSAALRDQVVGLHSKELCWLQDDQPGFEDHASRPWNGARLLDIADYIANTACFIEEFFLVCHDGLSVGPDAVRKVTATGMTPE